MSIAFVLGREMSQCDYNSAYEPRLYSTDDGKTHLRILSSAKRLRLYSMDNVTTAKHTPLLQVESDLGGTLAPVAAPERFTWMSDYVRFYQLDSFTKGYSGWYLLCSDFKMFRTGLELNCTRCYALPLANSAETADSEAQVVTLAGNLYDSDGENWWATDILTGSLPTPNVTVTTSYYERYVNSSGKTFIQRWEEALPPNSISLLNTTLTRPAGQVEFFSVKAKVEFSLPDFGKIVFASPYDRVTYMTYSSK